MKTRLFHTVVLFGAALGAAACGSGSGLPGDGAWESDAAGGGADAATDAATDAGDAAALPLEEGGFDAAPEVDAGWPPTK